MQGSAEHGSLKVRQAESLIKDGEDNDMSETRAFSFEHLRLCASVCHVDSTRLEVENTPRQKTAPTTVRQQ
jgi:hypothetical protein